MQPQPLVSVIIPTYNHLSLLKACIDSIIAYTNLGQCEVIVVANGCTDGTVEYLRTLPPPFKHVVHEKPLGYTAATNFGIREATGEYVVLLNNDTVILGQPRNQWIDLLLEPFRKDPKTGITGPVKFSWDCGGIQRHAMAFWCVMIPRKLFTELGLLDEIYSPGMGEDGDFSIKAEMAGYRLVQVPQDGSAEFGKGIPVQQFPIYHMGSGTFSDKDYSEVAKRNTEILKARYGMKKSSSLESIYAMCLNHPCDTNQLFPKLRSYAERCDHITEFGVRGVFTTWAFLARVPKRMVSYDIEYNGNIEGAKKEAAQAGISFEFRREDTLKAEIEPTDLLFIDTTHTYKQLKGELDRHAGKVRKYILIHDTESFGEKGEDGGPGEKLAISEFLAAHPEWKSKEHIEISNGLTILERGSRYHLPPGYKHRVGARPFVSHELGVANVFQQEVYARAAEIFVSKGLKSVIDVGCGSGDKLLKYFSEASTIGIEVEPVLSWLKKTYPNRRWEGGGFRGQTDLVICADVLEHLEDPDKTIAQIKELNPKFIVLSTPDRGLGKAPEGPPENPHHVREWSFGEFKSYVSSHFDVLEHFYSNKAHGTQCVVCVPKRAMNYSIVIPTCGKDWDKVLKKCVEAVIAYTDLSDKEIVVIPNGAPREAIEYLATQPLRGVGFPDRIGYIRAVNEGISTAKGDLVVLLDDDSFLMPQAKDDWIRALKQPFLEDPLMAAAGPFGQTYNDLGQVLHSGCTMYRTEALKKVGLFDEAFNPGYMGDEDLAIRLRKAGFHIQQVPKGHKPEYKNGVFEVKFPVVHTGTINTMPKHTTDLPIVEKNRKLLYERHGKPSPVAPVSKGPASEGKKAKISVVIPTFNHLEDLLKPNLKSMIEFTDLSNVEVIVVANGCTDGTEDYVRSLGDRFRVLSFPDALGYTRATNEGIKVATGDYIILYNNDNVLLGQPKNKWLDCLLEPFQGNPKMGITGPLQLHDDYAGEDVIIGFCLCISRTALEAAGGLLDEIYSPGGGEDIDLCCKVRRKGFVVRQVPKEGKLGFSHTNTGDFPIWHVNNQTFKDIPEYTKFIVKKNGLINLKRYNKDIKLNIGSGGIEHRGYLSVDLFDQRANIIMDVTQLDFEENSVSEILAIHVFEHLNPYHCLDILKRWRKILKPGGKLVMEMPDIEALCKRFVTANTGERYGILNAVYGSVNTTSVGGPDNITSPHLFGWWPQSLWDHLTNAGFINIVFGPEKFPHPESNLHVEATKPG